MEPQPQNPYQNTFSSATSFLSISHSSTCMVLHGQMSKYPCMLELPLLINTRHLTLPSHHRSSATSHHSPVMATIIKARLPLLLLLLGIVFLASVSVSFGFAYWEEVNPRHDKCVRSCNSENDAFRYRACQARCKLTKNPLERRREGEERERQEEEEEEQEGPQREPERESLCEEEEQEEREPREQRHRHQGRKQETEKERRRKEHREERQEEEEEEEGERGGRRHRDDPEERARERQREERREQRREEKEEERQRRREKREQEEEREGQGSQSQRQKNPYYFGSKRFQTRYKNEHGRIRVLQRFDQRSKQLRNLQNYRVVEYEAKPNTLILPHHSDAEYILVLLKGEATITLVNPNNRESYNIERGDALRIPAGTTTYLANRHDNQNLRVAKLAIPVNKPGQFEDFFSSGSQNLQSYYSGFSKNTLEATFNTQYEEIQKILLGEEEQQQQQQRGRGKQQSQEGVIVKVSKEQIRELSQHAKSSSRRGISSESGPFNLRNRQPRYSNKYGKFYEVTPEKNPQLQDLGISLTCLELNEGSLMLPHYNSEAIVVAVVSEGKGRLELVGLREQRRGGREEQEEEEEEEEEEEQEQEERSRQVQRITANLSQGDVFIIPAGHPVALNASSDLHVLGFGLNAENNQRNFLGGDKDNVINQIHRQVKELAFPGSGEDVEKLIRNQRESHFVNAQPQQKEGRQGRKGPLSSILGAFY